MSATDTVCFADCEAARYFVDYALCSFKQGTHPWERETSKRSNRPDFSFDLLLLHLRAYPRQNLSRSRTLDEIGTGSNANCIVRYAPQVDV